jgi:hypothetical protein
LISHVVLKQVNELIPEKYPEDEELIRLTIEQLRKDFGSHFPAFHFSGQKEKLFGELTVQVAEALQEVRRTNPVFLKVILYQVDVPESVANALKEQKDCFSLAEIVIQREFKKVITRRFFSR